MVTFLEFNKWKTSLNISPLSFQTLNILSKISLSLIKPASIPSLTFKMNHAIHPTTISITLSLISLHLIPQENRSPILHRNKCQNSPSLLQNLFDRRVIPSEADLHRKLSQKSTHCFQQATNKIRLHL